MTLSRITVWLAILALAALSFHAIDMHHNHPDFLFGSDELNAAIHGGNKHWWLILALLTTLVALALRLPDDDPSLARGEYFREIARYDSPQRDFLQLLFRTGILHGRPF